MRYFYGKHKIDNSYGFCSIADNMTNEIHSEYVEISENEYNNFLKKQQEGFEIYTENGYPILKEHVNTETEKSIEIRYIRDSYLKNSDIKMLFDNYTKLSDEERENWIAYRQYLRDIPQSENFPNEIVLTFDEFNLQKQVE